MRILAISTARKPSSSVYMLTHLTKRVIEKRGIEYDIVFSPEGSFLDKVLYLVNSGFNLDKAYGNYMNSCVRNNFSKLISTLDLDKYDVIHFQGQLSAGLFHEKHDPGIPSITTVHGFDWEMAVTNKFPINGNYYNFVLETSMRGLTETDRIIAVASIVKEKLISYGIQSDKITIVNNPNPVDLEAIQTIKTHNLPYEFVYVSARLNHDRGIDLAIKAFSYLCRKYPNLKLLIAGGGNLISKIEFIKMAKGLCGRGRVVFLGPLPRAENLRYMKTSRVVWVPSRLEGTLNTSLSLVMLEAMALKKPVVISGHREGLIHGFNSFILDAPDPEGFADLTEQILSDPELEYRVTERAFEIPLSRDLDAWGKKLEGIFKEIVQ